MQELRDEIDELGHEIDAVLGMGFDHAQEVVGRDVDEFVAAFAQHLGCRPLEVILVLKINKNYLKKHAYNAKEVGKTNVATNGIDITFLM